jgi:predicted aspartyl protease
MNFFAVYVGFAGAVPRSATMCLRFGGKLVSNSSGEVLMVLHVCAKVSAVRFLTGLVFVLAACGFAVRNANAVPCPVVHHGLPSDADKAYLASDYKTAENLYRAQLAANPGNPEVTAGLVHSLLEEQKIHEAADAVNVALAPAPHSPALITLRGEVELREGEPWTALGSAGEAFKLDPCNPRTRLLLARLSKLNSYYASAQEHINAAHSLDPDDIDIQFEWIATLPPRQQIAALESLVSRQSVDPQQLKELRSQLDEVKKLIEGSAPPCRLVSDTSSTEIPFVDLMTDATHQAAYGMVVNFNGHDARLLIDTGAGGITVSRSVAKRAGLKTFAKGEMGGIGDEGEKAAFAAYADSIRIGGLEFQNCTVSVLDSSSVVGSDGLIGADVFSKFLVTLDYPAKRLILDPLPPRPGETQTQMSLNTTGAQDENDDALAAINHGPAAQNAPPILHDRYIAPQMQDYMHVFRVGHNLLVPAQLNGQDFRLFILDTGAYDTFISPEAARRVTNVHRDDSFGVRGISGEVRQTYMAGDLTFRFAQLSERVHNVGAFDMSDTSKKIGIEIAGFLGATTWELMTIHIDYRDGLVKFDYDPKRVPRADYRNGLVR